MEKIAFFGLGTMGKPMVDRLCDAGYAVAILATSNAVADLQMPPITIAPNPRVASKGATVVILSVPDSTAVEDVVYGDDGILESIQRGSLLIDMGTSDPTSTCRISGDLAERGVDMLDAPVSGGRQGAISGTLSCMVGGRREAFERAAPLLGCLAATLKYVGGPGSGHTMKLLNNMVALGNLGVLCEVMSLAVRLGVELPIALEVFAGGSADSRVLDFWGKRLAREEYTPATYRFDLALKDIRLAHATVAQSGIPSPVFDAIYGTFARAAALGAADEDVSVLKANWDRLVVASDAPSPGATSGSVGLA
jgi:3-hydroxyisobutyrate dehydrogenase-like beta-hydroxyacid dehydrogenase